MLRISTAQFDTLAVPFEAAFVARVGQFVREKAPALVEAAGAEFEPTLADALRDAREHGVVSEREQVLHVILCLVHGVGFAAREPWAMAVVRSRREAGYTSGLPQALMDAAGGVPGRGG